MSESGHVSPEDRPLARVAAVGETKEPIRGVDLRYQRLRPHRVVNPLLADVMRQIRNSCREFMTNRTEHIDYIQQRVWWHMLDHSRWRCYLYELNLHHLGGPVLDVGYGVIQPDRDPDAKRLWLTGGILPDYRGLGFGKQIFRHLIDECFGQGEVWLEVREDNLRAKKLYYGLGFVPEERTDLQWEKPGVIAMRLNP